MNLKIINKDYSLYYLSNLDTKNFNKYELIKLQVLIDFIHKQSIIYNNIHFLKGLIK